MDKLKIVMVIFFTFVSIFILKVESIGTSGYMKIVLKNGQVFYGKIHNEGNNGIIIEKDATLINFKRKEIESIVDVETLKYKKEEKHKDVIVVAKFSSDAERERDKIEKFIKSSGEKYKVDPHLIKAIIKVESNFDKFATSSKGARGLMQLMPETAQIFGISDSYNPYQNIEGGVRYFRRQLNEFNDDVHLALAAYNAGPRRVKKYNGIPPYSETRKFIKKVLHFHDYFKEGKAIVIPEKVIYAFKDKGGTLNITDVPQNEKK